MKSHFREQKKKNDRDAREWDAICRELRRLFPDMSKATHGLWLSTYGKVTPAWHLYHRIKNSGLWDVFALRCECAVRGLRSWESVTDPLA